MFPFRNGRPRRPHPTVEAAVRVATPPARGVARETVRVAIGGVELELGAVRQPRINGAQEAYWQCPQCGALRWHLYVHQNALACRVCLGLTYACRRTGNGAVIRAAKLRRRLSGLPGLLSPLPPRPKYWRPDYYARALAELVAVESVIAVKLLLWLSRGESAMTDIALEQRDEQVAEALEAGRSLRTVQKQFSLTQAELDAALERLWPIDQQARLRLIKRDVGKLDRLNQVFYEKALAGDVQSGLLSVRISERLHALLGLEAAQRVDLTIMPREAPQSFDRALEVVMRLARSGRRQDDGNGAADLPSEPGT